MQAGETIRLLTRYHVGAHNDPRENRLTAAVAALLAGSRGVGLAVARAWLGDESLDGPVDIRVQRPVGGNVGWVDLQLKIGASRPRIVWVEVKLGHRLSGDNQLEKYRTRLGSLDVGATERLVLLLAPAQRRAVFEEYPDLARRRDQHIGPFFTSWQDLYGLLAAAPRRSEPAHVRWLLTEVLAYMKAEGLKPTELKPRHLNALHDYDEAVAALTTVLSHARMKLDADWTLASQVPKPELDEWEYTYRARRRGEAANPRSGAELSWGIEGAVAFAGVYFKLDAGGAVRPRADDEWRITLLDRCEASHRWETDDESRDAVWIGKKRKLKDILSLTRVESQAEQLAGFVQETFSAIVSASSTG